ncbi:hypothetical protein OTU49_002645 [Cherax quadricarinatus]|uniref:EF-hand domain-containing protein n=1 Tax=Cherax quadricarinatus TaxID=27406 RepID=A0AAW0XN58_CHEQU
MRIIALWLSLGVWVGCGLEAGAIEGSGRPMHMKGHHSYHQVKQESNKHHHHVPKRPQHTGTKPKLLQDNDLLHDRQHLKEELPEYLSLERIEKMSDKELDYHYFKIHDYDNNFGLDGLELLAAIVHIAADDDDDDEVIIDEEKLKGLSQQERKILQDHRQQKWDEKLKFYTELVDDVLDENDNNKDGYLSWGEFRLAQNRRK